MLKIVLHETYASSPVVSQDGSMQALYDPRGIVFNQEDQMVGT